MSAPASQTGAAEQETKGGKFWQLGSGVLQQGMGYPQPTAAMPWHGGAPPGWCGMDGDLDKELNPTGMGWVTGTLLRELNPTLQQLPRFTFRAPKPEAGMAIQPLPNPRALPNLSQPCCTELLSKHN